MFDLIIRNGLIVDGTSVPRRSAEVAIRDMRISRIGAIGDRLRAVARNGYVTQNVPCGDILKRYSDTVGH